ncbi:hypothetical protein D8674_026207 [Pyrus ussuriensis x Pyrus communis]|uniref:Uncharacterized protein n=1 Tax=Pyrus ussuriensis x Pyrus communis TaxID=2448454 RepID=A0A5N5I9A9_9ROSA|nr:hypothetical protein D8674_026207 [Pyrus ussuriensis x Pyrus communis]
MPCGLEGPRRRRELEEKIGRMAKHLVELPAPPEESLAPNPVRHSPPDGNKSMVSSSTASTSETVTPDVFSKCTITQILRIENGRADTLARLASASEGEINFPSVM